MDHVKQEESNEEKDEVKSYAETEVKVGSAEKDGKGSSCEFVQAEVEEKSEDSDAGAAGGANKRSIKSKFKHLIKKWRQ